MLCCIVLFCFVYIKTHACVVPDLLSWSPPPVSFFFLCVVRPSVPTVCVFVCVRAEGTITIRTCGSVLVLCSVSVSVVLCSVSVSVV